MGATEADASDGADRFAEELFAALVFEEDLTAVPAVFIGFVLEEDATAALAEEATLVEEGGEEEVKGEEGISSKAKINVRDVLKLL